MKTLKETPFMGTKKINKAPDVRLKDTFVNLKATGMQHIRQALADMERGRFIF